MTRVILTLLSICQSFCLWAAEIGFAEPRLLGGSDSGRPKVVIVRNSEATHAFRPRADVVSSMVERGVVTLTGQATPALAWRSLVSTQDIIGIKVHAAPGPDSGTRPAVAEAVVKGLLAAGISPSQVILWDRRYEDLQGAGFIDLAASLGVRAAGATDSGFDPEVFYPNPVLGQLVFGDLEFGRSRAGAITNQAAGRNSHLSRLLTREITRLINIAPLLNHNEAGVSGVLYTVASASTDNFLRFEAHASLLATAVPEIYGQTNIADHVALNIVDALVGQYEGRQRSRLNYAGTPNEIRLSTDPVALDLLSIEELNRLRAAVDLPIVTNRFELYQNAHLLELGSSDLREVEVIRLD